MTHPKLLLTREDSFTFASLRTALLPRLTDQALVLRAVGLHLQRPQSTEAPLLSKRGSMLSILLLSPEA